MNRNVKKFADQSDLRRTLRYAEYEMLRGLLSFSLLAAVAYGASDMFVANDDEHVWTLLLAFNGEH